MLSKTPIQRVYLAMGATDLRKSIDGLAAIVQMSFQLDPFSSNLFVFCNRKRDKLKILHWDHNGFWLYYRRLENGVFQWPDGLDKLLSRYRSVLVNSTGCWMDFHLNKNKLIQK